MLKAVIFDMDGVIIDSEPLHARANILACKQFGIDLSYEYVMRFIGNTILYMCETIKKDYGLNLTAKQLSEESARQIELLHAKEGYTPVPYVKELIQNLHGHGLKLAIASSSTPELIEKIVEVFELKPYFTKLISGLSVAHSKPAPDIFLKACEELGVSTEEAIILEDSANGVLAANRANIPVIGFSNPHSGNQDLSKASIIIEGFEEIDTAFLERTYCHAHNLPATIAKTERLTIRELTLSDVPALYALYQDETFVANHLSFAASVLEAYQKQEAYIKHMYQFLGFGLWGVFFKDTNQLIGHCGIEPKEIRVEDGRSIDIFELGYGIQKEYQQKGYAKEAVSAILSYAKQTLYLNQIHAVIDVQNEASLSLIKNLGFQQIDVLSADVSKDSSALQQSSRTKLLFRMKL